MFWISCLKAHCCLVRAYWFESAVGISSLSFCGLISTFCPDLNSVELILSWLELIWADSSWFELTWADLSWFELIWADLSWFELSPKRVKTRQNASAHQNSKAMRILFESATQWKERMLGMHEREVEVGTKGCWGLMRLNEVHWVVSIFCVCLHSPAHGLKGWT